jgi:hypothetical protein
MQAQRPATRAPFSRPQSSPTETLNVVGGLALATGYSLPLIVLGSLPNPLDDPGLFWLLVPLAGPALAVGTSDAARDRTAVRVLLWTDFAVQLAGVSMLVTRLVLSEPSSTATTTVSVSPWVGDQSRGIGIHGAF